MNECKQSHLKQHIKKYLLYEYNHIILFTTSELFIHIKMRFIVFITKNIVLWHESECFCKPEHTIRIVECGVDIVSRLCVALRCF